MSTPLNDLQRKFVKYCAEGHNICLISMADTGKSTALKATGDILKFSGKTVVFGLNRDCKFKILQRSNNSQVRHF